MAKKAGKKQRSGASLGFWIFLVIGLLVLVSVGGAAAVIWRMSEEAVDAQIEKDLSGSQNAHGMAQRQRYGQLQLISRILKTDPGLISYLASAERDDNRVAILDAITEYQDLLRFDLAVALDRDGIVLQRTDDPAAVGGDMSAAALVAAAFEESDAIGVWREGDKLYHAVAVRLAQQFDLVGCMIVALAINDSLAGELARAGGADVVYLIHGGTGPEVTAGTIGAAVRGELIPALRRSGQVLQGNVELELQGGPWKVSLKPLKDVGGETVGAVAALVARNPRLIRYRNHLRWLAALGGGALSVGLLAALLLGSRAAKPTAQLAAAVEQAAQGDLRPSLPSGGMGVLGRAARSLEAMLRELREKTAFQALVSRVSRLLPEPAKSVAAARPRTVDTVLLAVEMRRFANPKISYDPEENLGRFSRDLKRIAGAAESRKGRIEAVSGHRVLAAFDGDGAPAMALAAATEVVVRLGERESVFDEPDPPVVALTSGSVIAGTVGSGGRPATTVAGLAVQQLESLLREAAPGEIYLSKQLYAKLGDVFQRAGVELSPQRGLLSPQPLYVLSSEVAGRVTGVSTAPQAAAGFPDETRKLTDVEAGSVLGQRFDVLAELGSGRMGMVFKAQDRELGDLVTLKLLEPRVVENAAHFEWLRNVIRLARNVRHPNVLAIHDFGEADGLAYITAEFERGMTLRFLFEHYSQLPSIAVLRLARQLGHGLAALHGERLLHRAIKPENVHVDSGGQARWMDFALSLPIASGGVIADVEYLAPEQIDGRQLDQRADVYSLGVVLYEALTGQKPVAGTDPNEVRRKHQGEPPAPPSAFVEVPAPLDRLVMRCLAKVPEQRYGSIKEVLAELDTVPS